MGIKTEHIAGKVIVIASVIGIAMATGRVAFAANNCSNPVARIVSTQGAVTLDQSSAHLDDEICSGVVIEVAANSRAAILLLGQNTILRIDQNTQYVVQSASEESPTIELLKGIIHFFSKVPESLLIKTPFVNAGVEGTEFVVQVGESQSDVMVVEGHVRVSNENGEVLLSANEAASAQKGQAPQRRQVVKPLDAVQWALHYPSVGISEKASIPTREAADLLAVGRVKEAEKNLNDIRKTIPNDAVIPALLAMIAVGQNRIEEAIALAEEAVAIDPNSSIAYTSLSYAQQSKFDIDAALLSSQQAVENDSNNAYAWARLAELQSSKGDLKASLQSAQKAVKVDPNLSRTQTVLGFAHLTRIEIEDAKTAFNKAISYDNADPLPRLGLGLAKIRKNQLAEGREQIEIAASLDPNNSLTRSYLGKAYFEEKRDALAAVQFDLAKELDSNDPTSSLYSAILKQTNNNSIGAVNDVQKSIRLNNQRAVYRSRLLIDEDLASRSVNLARLYGGLGFNALAQLEASKSLSVNPSDYSAHRFLSDSYANRPRHEIARVSELLQSQLLQPININPIQPELAETNLNIETHTGLPRTSFNEYTSLTMRESPRFNVTGIGGNNGIFADELVLSGISENISYSFGQYHFESDGFRANNSQAHDIYNVFAQAHVTESLDAQIEYRSRETEQGFLGLSFEPTFLPDERRELDQESIRLGLHYSQSPESDILTSLIYNNKDTIGESIDNSINPPFIDIIDIEERSTDFQTQYIRRGDLVDHTAGFGLAKIDADGSQKLGVGLPLVEIPTNQETEQFNSYYYGSFQAPSSAVWTIGLSHDVLESGALDIESTDPKLGVRFNLNEKIGVRFAALQTLKRFLTLNQTLEPTQVAGFNQFFDDRNGTESKLYGVGFDFNGDGGTYGGLELVKSELKNPIFGSEGIIFEDREADNYRVYLYRPFSKTWAISAEYQQEKYSGGVSEVDRPSLLETKTLPLAIRYFGDNRWFGALQSTFVWQEISNSDDVGTQSEDFALTDLSLGYRLKNRRGTLDLHISNLFDRNFRFQDSRFINADPYNTDVRFIPDRVITARFKLNF